MTAFVFYKNKIISPFGFPFLKTRSLNSLISKNNRQLLCSSLEIHYIVYKILKNFKFHKRHVLYNSSLTVQLNKIGLQLQMNRFYLSPHEKIRSYNRKFLLESFYGLTKNTVVKSYEVKINSNQNFFLTFENTFFQQNDLFLALQFFNNKSFISLSKKNLYFVQFLKKKGFLNNVYSFQFFKEGLIQKKLYKSLRLLPKIYNKSLVSYFLKNRLDFVRKKVKKDKLFKKFVWKRRKRRKWKNLLTRFKDRQRFLKKFYIPRHFEINYKTLCLVHLGFFDSKTVEYRIPFWLNLRKLTTFFSS